MRNILPSVSISVSTNWPTFFVVPSYLSVTFFDSLIRKEICYLKTDFISFVKLVMFHYFVKYLREFFMG